MASPAVRRVMVAVLGTAERAVTDVLVEAHANLIEDTPIDTGNAAANWLASIGAPDARVVGSPESVDRGISDASVVAAVRAYKLDLGPVYLSNHVEYISKLNDGSSTQAPAGFVESAVARAVETVAARNR